MCTKDIIEGLLILNKYSDPTDFSIGSGHDELWFYKTDKTVSKKDIKELIKLDWFQPETIYEDDYTEEDYDKEEGWRHYV